MQPAPQLGLKKIGTEYGGWIVPSGLVRAEWICYSGGAGEDISFDIGLIQRFGRSVNVFDPTPRAIAHVQATASAEPRLRFLPVGLWSKDTTLRFFAPRDPTHVSHSALNLQQTTGYFEATCRSIPSLMRELGHTGIDLLKLDVEGAEHQVIASTLAARVQPTVLCTEIDRPVSPLTALVTVARLLAHGYALVAVDAWNLTFVLRSALDVLPDRRSDDTD